MVYSNLSSINNSDFSGMFVYVNEVTNGLFSIMLLVAVFAVTVFGSFYSSRRLTGEGDFVASFAVGAYLTTGLGFLMLLIDGLMTVTVVLIALVLSIMGTVWLYFDKRS